MIRKATRSILTVLFLIFSSLLVAAAPGRRDDPIEHAKLLGALRLEGELFHVQGLVVEGSHIWITSVDRGNRRGYLHKFDRATGRFLQRLELTDGARYHPGGISISGRSIWVPVAEFRPHSSAVLEEIDADTLQVRRRIAVGDHLGCVAVSGTQLVAGNWDSELLYIFELGHTSRVRTVPNPSPTHYQDMKFVKGQLVAAGTLNWWRGSIDWIDWPSMKLARTLQASAIGPGRPFGRSGTYTEEGMAIEGRDLYLVPEDGPSRVYHFRLDASEAEIRLAVEPKSSAEPSARPGAQLKGA